MKQAFIERGSIEGREVWNLITLNIDEDDKESTEVTSYATKPQAERAKKAFLENGEVDQGPFFGNDQSRNSC